MSPRHTIPPVVSEGDASSTNPLSKVVRGLVRRVEHLGLQLDHALGNIDDTMMASLHDQYLPEIVAPPPAELQADVEAIFDQVGDVVPVDLLASCLAVPIGDVCVAIETIERRRRTEVSRG